MNSRKTSIRHFAAPAVLLVMALGAAPPAPRRVAGESNQGAVGINRPISVGDESRPRPRTAANAPLRTPTAAPASASVPPKVPAPQPPTAASAPPLGIDPQQAARSLQTVALFAVVSFAPAGVLMLTAFVRINVVLVLLRQALGSPQVPGNQVLSALALLLTVLVMQPTGEAVYRESVRPFAAGELSWSDAYERGAAPIKSWMIGQIEYTRHERYLWTLYDLAIPSEEGHPDPAYFEDFPMRVVAPAFLLSELTTAMVIGFYLYLPFLVVDLVTAAVLSSAGLFMLPPSLVALPLKLILFVLADGWLEVAAMLIQSFGPAAGAWRGGG